MAIAKALRAASFALDKIAVGLKDAGFAIPDVRAAMMAIGARRTQFFAWGIGS